ncbi:LPS export ABC transporter periplasmic protein LptC [Aquimarina sp. ERC-38]|uniref:LPS export ABC transporter periplasmic protein LptC n=1 Tax=Aquimarina sp. ERC-38 TaxID=2949996 RepID=UPI0022456666|nr:LPS export ABC transporter periplasmic protein LptC [Aquimarina sp. ERC-38]UZO81448.1 LPS export ABC transporter periplasmic protein LptC [Aquimarina sp. ERC-38]
MRLKKTYTMCIVITLVMAMFFSCTKSNSTTNNGVGVTKDKAIAEAFEVQLKYTDSGRLTAILNADKILDFTNKEFAYWEFPDGIALDMIDIDGKVSTVTADYAISYQKTGLIDMQGNVDIKTADSTHLEAQQLYWDQNLSWVFTDQPYKSTLPDGTINNGNGFDANQNFTVLNSRINDGIMFVKE